jgi:hypothetical protein
MMMVYLLDIYKGVEWIDESPFGFDTLLFVVFLMILDHLPPKINRCNCCDDSEVCPGPGADVAKLK